MATTGAEDAHRLSSASVPSQAHHSHWMVSQPCRRHWEFPSIHKRNKGPGRTLEELFHILLTIVPFLWHPTSRHLTFLILHRKNIYWATCLPEPLAMMSTVMVWNSDVWLSPSCHDGGLACAQQPSCLAFLTSFTLILRRESPNSLCGCLSASGDANEAVSCSHD